MCPFKLNEGLDLNDCRVPSSRNVVELSDSGSWLDWSYSVRELFTGDLVGSRDGNMEYGVLASRSGRKVSLEDK